MLLHDGNCHDVEYSASVSVFWIRELFIAPAVVVSGLNLSIHLPPVISVQEDAIFTVG